MRGVTESAKHHERYAAGGVKSIILVGSGAELVVDRKKLPHTRRIHPVDMNAMGSLRLALMRPQHT